MDLLTYLRILPIKKYNFFLMKKNKNKKLRFKLRDENLRLVSVYKNAIDKGGPLFDVAPENDMRRRKTQQLRSIEDSEINKHDGIKIVFEYEDW